MRAFTVVDHDKRGEAKPARQVSAADLAELARVEGWPPSLAWDTETGEAGDVWMVGRRGMMNRVHVKVRAS